MSNAPLYILDGYALIYRSYYSMGNAAALRNSKGENITAIIAFFRSVLTLIRTYDIKHFVVALDPKEPSFRKQLLPSYKANREAAPDELIPQADHIERLLNAAGIKTVRIAPYEADDIIASLAHQRLDLGLKSIIISGDKDLMQLVNPDIHMLRFTSKREFKAGVEEFHHEDVYTKMGVYPNQIHDYLAIVGDSSDNIPGVAGIGPKGAIKLLESYNSLNQIYEHIDSITPVGTRNKLIQAQEMARLSWQLVDLVKDISLPSLTNDSYALSNADFGRLASELQALDILQVAQEALRLGSGSQEVIAVISPQQDRLKYHVISTLEEVDQLFTRLKEAKLFAYDSETTGLNPHTDSIVGISFSLDGQEGYYIPFNAPITDVTVSWAAVKPKLIDLFSDEHIKVIGQNIKFDIQFLHATGITLRPYFDTMIAAWLIDSQARVNLDALAKQYLNRSTIAYSDIVGKNQRFDEVPLSLSAEYACEDATLTYQLYQQLEPRLIDLDLSTLFYTLEMPLVSLLAQMEYRGIFVDRQELVALGKRLQQQITVLEQEIIQLAGQSFNIQSPKQLGQILFDHLKFPNLKKGSTDVHILNELHRMHPGDRILSAILEYRKLSKLNSTYVEGLLKEISSNQSIHTSFLQTGTASGRLSSTNPNLQNIPIKDLLGREIRSAFKARPGYQLLSADYSQIELVVLAHLANDEVMLQIFKDGRDLHKETAAFLFSTPLESVSADQRRIGKTINFGVIYGMSAFRLSNELQITRALATEFIDSYFTRYAQVAQLLHRTVAYAQEHGHVRTVLNRMRLLHQINSRNHTERSADERVALNTIIQGSAADIVKIAMLNIDNSLKAQGLDAHLLLQVHDELILEVANDIVDNVQNLVQRIMIEAGLQLPQPMQLAISSEIGANWGLFH